MSYTEKLIKLFELCDNPTYGLVAVNRPLDLEPDSYLGFYEFVDTRSGTKYSLPSTLALSKLEYSARLAEENQKTRKDALHYSELLADFLLSKNVEKSEL